MYKNTQQLNSAELDIESLVMELEMHTDMETYLLKTVNCLHTYLFLCSWQFWKHYACMPVS